MKRKLIYLVALFLLMLVAGVFLGTWFALTRSLETLTPGEFIHIGKMIINNVSVALSILMPLCIIMIIVALWFYRYKRSAGFYLGLTSFFLFIVSVIITWLWVVPINDQILHWTDATMPPQWEYVRDQWKMFHALITLSTLASFGCFSWFILAAMKKNKTANYW